MIPLIKSKKTKEIKIKNKCKNKERGKNNFLIKTLKLFSLFLLLMISNKLLKLKINNIKNKNESPIISTNNNSTLKNQYFTRFEKIFSTYRNETESSNEYKNKFKKYLLNEYSSIFKKKYKKIDVIILVKKLNFGNAIFVINNLIYFCEILGCKKIYLNKDYWFVKKPIYDKDIKTIQK